MWVGQLGNPDLRRDIPLKKVDTMRLLVVTNESPVPAIHGGRVDQWTRFRLLRERGCRLMLVSWYLESFGRPAGADLTALNEVFDQICFFPIERTPRALLERLIQLPIRSPHVATRVLSASAQNDVIAAARSFGPDAVLLDGLYGGETALRLSRSLGLPFLYRAHNIEFDYMRSQASAATNKADWVAWRLASLHLKSFETMIQKGSRLVFDISYDDLEYWRSKGVSHSEWAPPLRMLDPDRLTSEIPWSQRAFDIVFLGNLYTPNNVRAVSWFAERVFPILRQSRPAIKVRIAGSHPTEPVRQLITANPEIDFLENPRDADAVWQDGRVLINPIQTGGGINVKAVEMLFVNAHLVTTSVGLKGFPSDIHAQFHVADIPEVFATSILRLIDVPYELTVSRQEARRVFSSGGIDRLIASISAVVN
jgi:hypothetical protein